MTNNFDCPEFDLDTLRGQPNSILIIGNDYSGKTDLAKKIIDILNIPTFVYSKHNDIKHKYTDQDTVSVRDKLFTFNDYQDISRLESPSLLVIEDTSSLGLSHTMMEGIMKLPRSGLVTTVLIIKYPQKVIVNKCADFVFMLPDRSEKSARTKCRTLGAVTSSFKQLLLDIDFEGKKRVMVRDRVKPNTKRIERLRYIDFRTFLSHDEIIYITEKMDEYLARKFQGDTERRYLSYIA